MNIKDIEYMLIDKKEERTYQIKSFRIPKRYREFIDKNNISVYKLFIKACEELEPSLKN